MCDDKHLSSQCCRGGDRRIERVGSVGLYSETLSLKRRWGEKKKRKERRKDRGKMVGENWDGRKEIEEKEEGKREKGRRKGQEWGKEGGSLVIRGCLDRPCPIAGPGTEGKCTGQRILCKVHRSCIQRQYPYFQADTSQWGNTHGRCSALPGRLTWAHPKPLSVKVWNTLCFIVIFSALKHFILVGI